MARQLPTYASVSDLRDVYPNIDKYDTKRQIFGWVDSTGSSGNTWVARNTGLVNQLFVDGVDLGAAQSSAGDVSATNRWCYDSATDVVTYFHASYTSSTILDALFEAGEDWATHQTDMLYKASRYLDSWIDSAMPRQAWKNSEDEYDYIIIRTTAQICAYFLISSMDSDNEDALRIKEEYEDVLEKINTGHIKLGFEITEDSSQGIIRELHASGTLKPVDLRGKYSGGVYDKIRIEIELAGVLGTAKYGVWVKGNDTLGVNKGQQIITSEIITGQYQSIGGGLEIRFGASSITGTSAATLNLLDASATLHDVWEVEVWGVGEEINDSRSIRSINAVRA